MEDKETKINSNDKDSIDLEQKQAKQAKQEKQIVFLNEEISSLQKQLEQEKELTLLAKANSLNIEKRAAQQIEKAHKFALEKFSYDLLEVVDNLERAIKTSKDKLTKDVVEGIELTLKNLHRILEKYGVKKIDAFEKEFNPEFHEAVKTVNEKNVETSTVVDVLQVGYTLNDRLLRPSLVVVSS